MLPISKACMSFLKFSKINEVGLCGHICLHDKVLILIPEKLKSYVITSARVFSLVCTCINSIFRDFIYRYF